MTWYKPQTILALLSLAFLRLTMGATLPELWIGAVLDPKNDLIPTRTQAIGIRFFKTVEPDAPSCPYSLAEQFNNFGIPLPPTQLNGKRLTTHGTLYLTPSHLVIDPVTGQDIWPRYELGGVNVGNWSFVNVTMPFLDAPPDLSVHHSIDIQISGAQDDPSEYWNRLMKMASYGRSVTFAMAHSCDWTDGFFGHVQNTYLWGRVADANAALQYILNENRDPTHLGHPFCRFGMYNEEQLTCGSHSDGGEACYLLKFGGAEQNIPGTPSPLFANAINVVHDPADFFSNYQDMQGSDFINLAIWTQNDDKTQAMIRTIFSNVNQVALPNLFVPWLIHQQLQFLDGALSIVAQTSGIIANSKQGNWMLPGQFYTDFFAVPSKWIETTHAPIHMQQIYDIVTWLDHQVTIAFGFAPIEGTQDVYVTNTNEYLHTTFTTRNMYALRDKIFPGLFLYFNGHQKCGNVTYNNVTTDLQIGYGTRFHGYAPTSDSTASDQYIENTSYDTTVNPQGTGTYIVDCHKCSGWLRPITSPKGRAAYTFAEPSEAQLVANPACNYP